MSGEPLADLLARREAEPATDVGAWTPLDTALRKDLEACSDLERDLCAMALGVRGHPERAGPWRLLRPLGSGTSGPVYLAEHESRRTRAVVRILTGPRPGSVLDAAKSALGWTHPGATGVLEVGDDWIAREASRGVSLARILLAEDRVIETDRREIAASLLRGLASVAGALYESHRRGLLHLSVSPRRIDVGTDGSMRIRDFGFDPVRGGRPPSSARPPLGSPLFLAPEQAGGGDVGPATDLHAFAAVVHTVAAGCPPANARCLSLLLERIRERDVRPLRERAPWVPADLARLTDTALARDPGARSVKLAGFAEILSGLSTGKD